MITPQQEVPQLAKRLGVPSLYLKREDLHPFGSHKGRSIPYMIRQYAGGGQKRFAISSSGNAALAALSYINEYNTKFTEDPLMLDIFVGQNIDQDKLNILKEKITDPGFTLIQTDRPVQSVHMLNKKGEAKALRQSNDPLALIGYQSLVDELSEINKVSAIFVPTSSGTTALALASKYPVHIVQTSACHPIAESLDTKFESSETSIADAIVDKVALRKDSLQKSLVGGWVVSDPEIIEAVKLVKDLTGIDISANSALSIAGLVKAQREGWQAGAGGAIVCLITGK